ncbi:MAG: hypothetical protein H6760_01290 [Candidatus Nomurabacteria bacterium]|nr:MAG: hypothetical protein H6760_01290 [Candidatus Nomurabacteria bacterium]
MLGYLLLIISVVEFFIGLYLIFRYEKSQATTYYGLFAISVAIYVAANGFGFTRASDNEFIFEQLAWFGGLLSAPFILGFSYSFPSPKKYPTELFPWVIWPVVLFGAGIFTSNIFLEKTYIYSFAEGYTAPIGVFFWFAIAVFAMYWIWAIRNLLYTRLHTSGFYRNFLTIVLIGLFSSLLISAIFDIYIPLVSVTRYGYIGALFSSIWLFTTAYLMVRK